MAEENDEDLELELADAGSAFRAEMWATNAIMGYWPYLVGALITGLLCVLFYGQYQTYVQRVQRATASKVADIERKLPVPLFQISLQKQSGAEGMDDETLCEAADDLVAIAGEAKGASSVEGYLKAAELYRLCSNADAQRAALNKAETEGKGVLGYAASAALANLDLEQGNGDEAIRRLERLRAENSGFLAEQAALDLGLALEHLGREADAQQVYTAFLESWPDSPRAEEVRTRQARHGGGAG